MKSGGWVEQGQDSGCARILIAEDDIEFSKLLQQVLRLQGHIVKTEFSVEAAQERVSAESFDLVVWDFVLPGMVLGRDPVEGVSVHKGERPAMVYMGAHPRGAQMIPRSEDSPSLYLRKPFSLPLFLEATSELLAHRMFRPLDPAVLESEVEAPPEVAAAPDADEPMALTVDDQAPLEEAVLTVRFRSLRQFLKEYGAHIAHGGLFVPCEESLGVGQPLRLMVEIPSQGKHQRVPVQARVAYVRPASAAGPAGVGVSLVGLEDAVRKAFQAAVAEAHSLQKAGRPARMMLYGTDSDLVPTAQSAQGKGLQVLHCEALEFLFEAVKKEEPDVLVMQLMELNGQVLDTLARLKSEPQTSHVPILMLGPEGARERGMAAGLDAYFEFPHDARELMRTAIRILQDPRRAHTRVRYSGDVEIVLPELVAFAEGVDLSEGGICVQAPMRLAQGKKVLLRMVLPDSEDPFEIPGEVVWCHDRMKGRGSRVGLVYQTITPQARHRLRCYIFYALQTQSNEILERTADLFEHVQRRQLRVPLSEPVAVRIGETVVYADGVDISTGGVGIVSTVRFEDDVDVELEMVLPNSEASLVVPCTVVGSQSTMGQLWRTGMMYRSPGEEVRLAIESFVLSWRNLA